VTYRGEWPGPDDVLSGGPVAPDSDDLLDGGEPSSDFELFVNGGEFDAHGWSEWDDWWITVDSGVLDGQPYVPGARIVSKFDGTYSRYVVVNPLPPGYGTSASPQFTIASGPPSDEWIAAFESNRVRIAVRVDLYEQDDLTPHVLDVGIESGSVSVDMTRSERRNLDLTIKDDRLLYGPGDFWYDKVIRVYRGIETDDGSQWLHPLGRFMPDQITRPRFPSTMSVSCRDFTKKLVLNSFPATTTFVEGQPVVDVIKAIALNGGVSRFSFAEPANLLPADITFEIGSSRASACEDLATSINHEVFFDAYGSYVLRPFGDPISSPITYAFTTGVTGNLVEYGRSTADSLMFNDVIVYGGSQENALVWGRAQNTDNTTPTSIARIGQRIKPPIANAFVADNATATLIAQSFLSVAALEQYDLTIDSIVIPWLEAGNIVRAELPDATLLDPDRFLLSSFSIPLGLGPMSATAKRVIKLG
jgi:hypothetical protein